MAYIKLIVFNLLDSGRFPILLIYMARIFSYGGKNHFVGRGYYMVKSLVFIWSSYC